MDYLHEWYIERSSPETRKYRKDRQHLLMHENFCQSHLRSPYKNVRLNISFLPNCLLVKFLNYLRDIENVISHNYHKLRLNNGMHKYEYINQANTTILYSNVIFSVNVQIFLVYSGSNYRNSIYNYCFKSKYRL